MLRFDEFVDEALYGDGGFYATTGHAGDLGDFITSVETGALFGELIAGQLDRWWIEQGRPDPFVVLEAGAGVGTLCTNIWRGVDACRDALRYVMVERTSGQGDLAFDRVVQECFGDLEEVPIAVARDLPAHGEFHVVVANELLDNLACRVLERSPNGWMELYVEGGEEVLLRADPLAVRMADVLAPDAPSGARVPLQLKAAVWVGRALGLVAPGGRLLVIDYGADTATLARRDWAGWARTFRGHRRGDDPLSAPGTQDITFDVAWDQLPGDPLLVSQREWLVEAGIDAAVELAEERWRSESGLGTRAALQARARLQEAQLLLDPDGLGGFTVATWTDRD